MKVNEQDYASGVENTWCPGCGNFGILDATRKALISLNLPPHRALICTGIGQAPKLPHFMRVNTFNGLHGREVAAATAAKLAADDLTVIVHAGEGGAYGEGGNHFLHAMRRNVDISLIVHDNKTYGLTKGQASPTTEQGTTTNLQRAGVASKPINPLALAVSQSCGFVAQGLSARVDQLADLIKRAIEHRGFSLLNVLQPCVSWDKIHTHAYYKQRCRDVDSGHDITDPQKAFQLATNQSDTIPLGIIYVHKNQPVRRGPIDPLRDRGVSPQQAEKLFELFI